MRPFLSVVIPAYNESANLRAGKLDKVAEYPRAQNLTHEVIVVDDGSEDDTASLAEAFARAGRRVGDDLRAGGGLRSGGVMARVAFFMLDGVRPDALAAADCPNGSALRQRGSAGCRRNTWRNSSAWMGIFIAR